MADNEMQLVNDGVSAAGKVGGAIAEGSSGFFSGLIGAPWAAAKGAWNTALRGSLWAGGAVALAAVTGLLKPALGLIGQEKWADKLATTLDPAGGGLPKFLATCLGAGAAISGTYGAARGAIGSIAGSTDATPEGAGMGLGGTLAVAAGAAVAIGAVVAYSKDDSKPGDSKTPAATPVKTAEARTNTAAIS